MHFTRQCYNKAMNSRIPPKRFLLVTIIPRSISDEEIFEELRELKELVSSYKGEVIDYLLQRREVHDKGLYIGSGKIDEAIDLIKKQAIDIVVLNALVKPGHLYDIKTELRRANPQIVVWDRGDLILEIFSLHAKTAEARLQIELAAMRHMGPRIYGMGMVLSRQTGGIGGRGIGETNTELMKRHWRDQIKKNEEKLKKLSSDRERQLKRREKNGLQTISLIGYTNAGKTTLFNSLTGKKKFAKDELFATLDSVTGKVFLPRLNQEILVSDTIGFIQNLPPRLIEAFKSTLFESMHADALLFVIDASDPFLDKKLQIVSSILSDLQIAGKPILYVFHKADTVSLHDKKQLTAMYEDLNPIWVSSVTTEGMDDLMESMQRTLQRKDTYEKTI